MTINKKILIICFFIVSYIIILGQTNVNAETEYFKYGNLEYAENSDGTIFIHRLLNRTETTEVTIPSQIEGKNVTKISAQFATPSQGEEVALKKITLPETIKTCGSSSWNKSAFEAATNLEEIIVDKNNPYFESVDGVLYSKDKTQIYCYPPNKTGTTYNIPNTVTSIKYEAFAFTQNLDFVNIPDCVTSIEDSAFAQSSIKSIKLTNNVKKVPLYAFYKCKNLESAEIDAGYIELDAFMECTNLINVKFGSTINYIRSDAFKNCTKLKNINFSESNIVRIDDKAFENCTALPNKIKMPSTMEIVEQKAFDDYISLIWSDTSARKLYDGMWVKCIDLNVTGEQDYNKAYEVFDLVNSQRENNNKPKLNLDKQLTDIAMQRAYEIAILYAHYRPEADRGYVSGITPYKFFEDTLYACGLYGVTTFNGENIAVYYNTSESVMKGWMNSTGHKRNILSEDFTNIGIGCVKTSKGYFWVQIFGNNTLAPEVKRNNKTETKTIPTLAYYVREGISLDSLKTSIKCGESINVVSKVKIKSVESSIYAYPDANSFKWSTSNKKILTVDENGKVTGKTPGKADVIITLSDGTTKALNITVTGGTNNSELPFKDIYTSDWYYEPVKYTYEKGLILGTTDITFSPNGKFSRAQLVTILWRMEGTPKASASNFLDIKASDWYYNAVNWAASKKIVNGYASGKFGPNDNITREQLAAILMNYARYKKKDVSKRADTSKFTDFNRVDKDFRNAVSWCVSKSIISGKSGGTKVDPKGTATRAEAAAMIRTYCLNVK